MLGMLLRGPAESKVRDFLLGSAAEGLKEKAEGLAAARGRLCARSTFSYARGCEVIVPSTHMSISLRQVPGASGSPSPNQFCHA